MKETPAYKHFLIELKRYFHNTIKRDYEPSSSPPFVIGGADIAAVAIAASRTPELNSVTQDMPYLPENSSDINYQYIAYGKIYDKYKKRMYVAGSRLQQIYRDSIEKLSKLKVFYEGKVRNVLKSVSYNPFRKSGLETRVEGLLPYDDTGPRIYLVPVREKYKAPKPNYSRASQNLEDRLAA